VPARARVHGHRLRGAFHVSASLIGCRGYVHKRMHTCTHKKLLIHSSIPILPTPFPRTISKAGKKTYPPTHTHQLHPIDFCVTTSITHIPYSLANTTYLHNTTKTGHPAQFILRTPSPDRLILTSPYLRMSSDSSDEDEPSCGADAGPRPIMYEDLEAAIPLSR
jgi:hypothetical protein